jgi:hypothetical protein
LIARVVHHASPRKARPLVKVNCAALPTHLIESELFGLEIHKEYHRKELTCAPLYHNKINIASISDFEIIHSLSEIKKGGHHVETPDY